MAGADPADPADTLWDRLGAIPDRRGRKVIGPRRRRQLVRVAFVERPPCKGQSGEGQKLVRRAHRQARSSFRSRTPIRRACDGEFRWNGV